MKEIAQGLRIAAYLLQFLGEAGVDSNSVSAFIEMPAKLEVVKGLAERLSKEDVPFEIHRDGGMVRLQVGEELVPIVVFANVEVETVPLDP